MPDLKSIKLVSSEISGLWDSYMSDSLVICVLKQFLNNVKITIYKHCYSIL